MSLSTQKDLSPPPGAAGDMTFVILISLVAAVGGLLFGFDTAVISGAIGFMTKQFTLNDTQTGFVASCVLIGCAVGAGFAGVLADRFGRKKILILSAIFFGVSAWGAAMPQHVLLPTGMIHFLVSLISAPARFFTGEKIVLTLTMEQFVVARFVGGLGIGIASMLSPLYIAEVAPARIRGRLSSRPLRASARPWKPNRTDRSSTHRDAVHQARGVAEFAMFKKILLVVRTPTSVSRLARRAGDLTMGRTVPDYPEITRKKSRRRFFPLRTSPGYSGGRLGNGGKIHKMCVIPYHCGCLCYFTTCAMKKNRLLSRLCRVECAARFCTLLIFRSP